MCTMHRSRNGKWQSDGDNVKVLATYSDDYAALVTKMIEALGSSYTERVLVCGGAIIPKETFVTLGHFFQAAHLKPGKVLFGIAPQYEVSSQYCFSLLPLMEGSNSKFLLLLILGDIC